MYTLIQPCRIRSFVFTPSPQVVRSVLYIFFAYCSLLTMQGSRIRQHEDNSLHSLCSAIIWTGTQTRKHGRQAAGLLLKQLSLTERFPNFSPAKRYLKKAKTQKDFSANSYQKCKFHKFFLVKLSIRKHCIFGNVQHLVFFCE